MHSSAITISTGATRFLKWYYKNNGAIIKLPTSLQSQDLLFFVHQQITFHHLQVITTLKDHHIVYPSGVNSQTKILDFLNNKDPKMVSFQFQSKTMKLKTKGCFQNTQLFPEFMNNTNSIYYHLKQFLQKQPQKNLQGSINYFLLHFYMRMTAQTYCKKQLNTEMMKQKMNQGLKKQITSQISREYQVFSKFDLQRIEEDIFEVQRNINKVKGEIMELQEQCLRHFLWYQRGAIGITTLHIVSFAYMIFFVDWLGWDIIEPLTYTVGVIYTLLGLRFYRKYKTNRTQQTIKNILMKQLINPKLLSELKKLENRNKKYEENLKYLQIQKKVFKNQTNFSSSFLEINKNWY